MIENISLAETGDTGTPDFAHTHVCVCVCVAARETHGRVCPLCYLLPVKDRAARVGPVVYGLLLAFRAPRRRLRLMRLPNLTKLHVHPCHYGAVVHIPPSGVARESSGPGGPLSYLLPVTPPFWVHLGVRLLCRRTLTFEHPP